METIKKHWITFLGIGFLFSAFLYFLKIAIDNDWINPITRVSLGFALGLSGVFFGYQQYKKNSNLVSEITAGCGLAILYATCAYASFSDQLLWSANSLCLIIIPLTLLIAWVSFTYNMRILSFMAVLGGLLTPIFIKAGEEQVWLLFFYVLCLNVVAIYLSALKSWLELHVMAFLTTIVIFSSYYLLFDPISWAKPMIYLSAFFMVYMLGLLVSSFKSGKNFEGINLYLNVLNAINFIFWSKYILASFACSFLLPAILAGTLFVGAGIGIFLLSNKQLVPSAIFVGLGILSVALATNEIGHHYATEGMQYVIITSIWLVIVTLSFLAYKVISDTMRWVATSGWFILLVYWFTVSFKVQWVTWFGLPYIPFLNPGALVWLGFIVLGFSLSKSYEKENSQLESTLITNIIALWSHVIVAALLTIQVSNLWDAYHFSFLPLDNILSVVWVLYSMFVFAWGAYSKGIAYKYVASVVLIVTSVKVFAFDLSGTSSLAKLFTLIIMGVLVLAISFMNQYLESKKTKASTTPLDENKDTQNNEQTLI